MTRPDPLNGGMFEKLDELLTTSTVVIDRPRGSTHPRYPEVIYPADYGYLNGTTSGDGQGIDMFVGTATGAGILATAITVDTLARDAEIKILLDCTPDEIDKVIQFLANTLHLGVHLVRRTPDQQLASPHPDQRNTTADTDNDPTPGAQSDPQAQPGIS